MSNIINRGEKNSVADLLGAVVSVAVPLIQLIAVTSIAFQEQLSLSDKLPNGKEVLPLTNLFVTVVVLSIIGYLLSSDWNRYRFVPQKQNLLKRIFSLLPKRVSFILMGENSPTLDNDIFEKVNLLALRVEVISFFIFYILFLSQGDFTLIRLSQSFFSIGIYFSYFVFYVCSGVIIFASIKKYFEMKQVDKPEHFFSNLVEALRDINILNEDKVVLQTTMLLPQSYSQYLSLISIKDKEYIIISDYTRKIVHGCWEKAKAPLNLVSALAEQYTKNPQGKTDK